MFDRGATYHKSAKGAEAIAVRSAALTPKQRSMLILVDGKRGTDELARLGQMLGDALQLLEQLADQEFIEPVAGTALPPAAPRAAVDPAAASASPVSTTVPLLQAQRYASRRLTDLMGPGAEPLCLRIERTRNAEEFMVVLHKAEAVLRDFGGSQLALRFMSDMLTHRPG